MAARECQPLKDRWSTATTGHGDIIRSLKTMAYLSALPPGRPRNSRIESFVDLLVGTSASNETPKIRMSNATS